MQCRPLSSAHARVHLSSMRSNCKPPLTRLRRNTGSQYSAKRRLRRVRRREMVTVQRSRLEAAVRRWPLVISLPRCWRPPFTRSWRRRRSDSDRDAVASGHRFRVRPASVAVDP